MMRFVTFTKAYRHENAQLPLGPIDARLCRFYLQPHIKPFYRMPEPEVEPFLTDLAGQCGMESAQFASDLTRSDPDNTTPNWFATPTKPKPKLPKKIILRYLGIVRYILEATKMPPRELLAIVGAAVNHKGSDLYRWGLKHTTMDYIGTLHAFQMTYSAYTKTRSAPLQPLALLDNIALHLYIATDVAPPMTITPTEFTAWLFRVGELTDQRADIVAKRIFGVQSPPAKRWAFKDVTPANNILRCVAMLIQYENRVNTVHNTAPDKTSYYTSLLDMCDEINESQPKTRQKK